jgi:hypothetical protein
MDDHLKNISFQVFFFPIPRPLSGPSDKCSWSILFHAPFFSPIPMEIYCQLMVISTQLVPQWKVLCLVSTWVGIRSRISAAEGIFLCIPWSFKGIRTTFPVYRSYWPRWGTSPHSMPPFSHIPFQNRLLYIHSNMPTYTHRPWRWKQHESLKHWQNRPQPYSITQKHN